MTSWASRAGIEPRGVLLDVAQLAEVIALGAQDALGPGHAGGELLEHAALRGRVLRLGVIQSLTDPEGRRQLGRGLVDGRRVGSHGLGAVHGLDEPELIGGVAHLLVELEKLRVADRGRLGTRGLGRDLPPAAPGIPRPDADDTQAEDDEDRQHGRAARAQRLLQPFRDDHRRTCQVAIRKALLGIEQDAVLTIQADLLESAVAQPQRVCPVAHGHDIEGIADAEAVGIGHGLRIVGDREVIGGIGIEHEQLRVGALAQLADGVLDARRLALDRGHQVGDRPVQVRRRLRGRAHDPQSQEPCDGGDERPGLPRDGMRQHHLSSLRRRSPEVACCAGGVPVANSLTSPAAPSPVTGRIGRTDQGMRAARGRPQSPS